MGAPLLFQPACCSSLAFHPVGVVPSPWPLALCCHPSVFTCSSSSDTLPDAPVSDQISVYSKLGKRILKYYQYQLFVWEPLNESHDNVREIDTIHTYKLWDHKIDLKLDTPSEHRSKNYPMSIDEQREVDKFLEEIFESRPEEAETLKITQEEGIKGV
jgi:hypothetical protein